MLQCAAEGRIDDDHLAPPQAQDLPNDGANVVHIHLLDDPTRLDLLIKSVAQSIKFVGRFGYQQRQLRQKCQLISWTHLLTPVNYSRPGRWVGRRTCWSTQRITRRTSTIYAVNRRGCNSRHRLQSTLRLRIKPRPTSADPR